jgi:hypothetical protein
VILFLLACKVPPEAPQELDELTHYLYREWANEDPAVLQAGMANMATFLSEQDLNGQLKVLDRSWELTSIAATDLHDVEWPEERNPADTYGVALGYESVGRVDEHAALQLEPDQLPVEPSAVAYERNYPDMDDPSCFSDRTCDVLFTENEITRKNLLMSISFTLHKHMRWVALEDDSFGMISRAHVITPTVGEGGNATVWQTYSMDVWLPNDNGSDRFQVLWSEADVAGASDNIQIGTIKSSINDHMEAADEVLALR